MIVGYEETVVFAGGCECGSDRLRVRDRLDLAW
jgi:hypothetical protein